MFFARKRSVTKRQQRVLFVRKRSDSNSTDVGYEGVITGRDALSFRSSTADPQGVTQPRLESTYLHSICFNKCHPQLLVMSLVSTKKGDF